MRIYQAIRFADELRVWVRSPERGVQIDGRWPERSDDEVYRLPPGREPGSEGNSVDFECGYLGRGPANLAFAVLMDHYEDSEKARAVADEFQRQYIESIPQFLTRWEFTTTELEAMVEPIERQLGWEAGDQEALNHDE
jgi:hypothetical protein